MVLPLLGLLAGAGGMAALGSRYVVPWIDEANRRRESGIREGLLQNIDPSDFNAQAGALMRGGLLDEGDWFQQMAARDRTLLGEQGAWDRAVLSEQGEWGRAGQDAQSAHDAALLEFDKEYQPRLDALSGQINEMDEVTRIISEMQELGPFSFNAWTGTPEGRVAFQKLQEMEERGFAAFKREVYGEAEPPPEELERLRGVYFTGSGRGAGITAMQEGRLDRALEVYATRREELQRQAEQLEQDYARGRALRTTGQIQTPGNLGIGNIAEDNAAIEGDGTVTMSNRSDPRLINSESGGNWRATNAEGMSGRAQFSPERLNEARQALGRDFSREEFLSNPRLQQAVEAWHFNDIEDFIDAQGLEEFIGETIMGIPITMQGLINVAHLGGKNGMRRFLRTAGRYNPADSNGTKLSDYLALGARDG